MNAQMNKTGYGHEMILAVSSLKPPHPRYRGRFAPSPTGPLHAGSLASALGSWLDARANQGAWLVRIEDLDAPALHCRHGPAYFGSVTGLWAYLGRGSALAIPATQGLPKRLRNALQRSADLPLFLLTPADYQRAEQPRLLRARNQEQVYPGTCRNGHVWQAQLPNSSSPSAWRLALKPDQWIRFSDAEFGPQEQNLNADVGDFVLRRADGIFAYQLAVVVDDARQGITHIVRGADLLSNTARQIYLQGVLGYATPQYRHLPLVLDPHGEKLSKQTLATEINTASDMCCFTGIAGRCIASGFKWTQ
jgi:glutamyl-Q tRNA(Asp) synthetase